MPINPTRSRIRDRNDPINRPEFLSLNQPLRNSNEARGTLRRPGLLKRQPSQQQQQQPQNVQQEPLENSTEDRRESVKLPEEDCIQLNLLYQATQHQHLKHDTAEPLENSTEDRRESVKLPEEDCIQLNPSFKGIARPTIFI
ncbi:inactive phospholipid phosphatase 7-like [Salvelinus sp. IW2-2015]|uniref:inactive phospholipid phosphatase 7-like n=1 Tax=Salvelinus sp. IW2-2015 TaxID=2691554 RepID=UPI0038D356B7